MAKFTPVYFDCVFTPKNDFCNFFKNILQTQSVANVYLPVIDTFDLHFNDRYQRFRGGVADFVWNIQGPLYDRSRSRRDI